jgi:chromosome segregation ATPase
VIKVEASLVAARARTSELERANKDLVEVVAQQRSRLDKHARIHVDRRNQLDGAAREGEALRTRAQQLESELGDARAEAKVALERADAGEARVLALERLVEAGEAKVAEVGVLLEREKEACVQRVKDAEATVKIKIAMLEDQNGTLGEMRKAKEESEKTRDRTTTQLREALARAGDAERRANALEAEVEAQDNAIRDLEGIVDDLKVSSD